MTHLVAVNTANRNDTAASILAHPGGAIDFTFSGELEGHYHPADQILWTRSTPRGIPCFSLDLLRAMTQSSRVIEDCFRDPLQRPLRYIILRSGVPGVFSVGGDLGYFHKLIVARDRTRLTEYAQAAVEAIHRNYVGHGVPGATTIALLEGDALGGGFEQALSCDIVIAERHVKAAFPEVLFDMFPGMGGLSFLARRTNRRIANELTRSGRAYSALELFDLGVVDAVVDTGAGVGAAQAIVRQRTHQPQAHRAMDAVDRMLRPVTLAELHDVVALWVDAALRLSERGRQWMRRLHAQQLAQFVTPASHTAAAAPHAVSSRQNRA